MHFKRSIIRVRSQDKNLMHFYVLFFMYYAVYFDMYSDSFILNPDIEIIDNVS